MELKERHYRAFLTKVNKSNGREVPFPTATFSQYKYYIGKGNNSILVRAALKTRFWWSMGDFDNWEEFHFMWTQWKSNKIIESLKMWKDCKGKEEDGAQEPDGGNSIASTHATDKECSSSTENLMTPKRMQKPTALSALKKNVDPPSNQKQKPFSSGVLPRRMNTQQPEESKEENITSHNMRSTNHMENNFHLSNKKAIYYNMKIYYEATNQQTFKFIPLTYHVREGLSDRSFAKFEEVYNNPDKSECLANYPAMGKSLWIVKPGENTNRGCGITVCKDLAQIRQIVSNNVVNGKKRSYIIQKYCERPLLYKGRKFDIRLYALVTCVNGNMQGYFYQDGYLRTACKEYNIKNFASKFIHLTNDAIQNRCADYGKFENGNKVRPFAQS